MSGKLFALAAVLASCLALGVLGIPAVGNVGRGKAGKSCMPMQWSASIIPLNAVNAGALTILAMQMDYGRQKQAMLNFTGSMETPVNKVIIDYAKKMLYSVATNYPTYCYKTPLDIPMIQCLPDDAEYLGSSYLGPYVSGAGKLPYDGYRARISFGNTSVIYTLALSQQDGVPLVESINYPDAPKMNQLFMFSAFLPKVTDPTVFDLPASCQK